ncbi:MAG TPA: MerR family DNA-binding protein, partial [Candidatus Polarisedimenticolia bacterium]|nr:MerR family DNA-binding protein [Candidatus Polarisedimenticolia bacterium]
YYERIGILPAAARSSGRRRYDETILHRLALIDVARRTGFSLAEIRVLFFGFREGTPASARWRALSRRKLAELDAGLRRLREMRRILRRLSVGCRCSELLECGRRLHAGR